MSYQSPIEVIQTQMRNVIEGEIYKAVMGVGVTVDKDELMKALAYDRNQYQKGYKDRDDQIVRCKNCRFLIDHYGFMDDGYCRNMRDEHYIKFKPDKDWFCADGKRR